MKPEYRTRILVTAGAVAVVALGSLLALPGAPSSSLARQMGSVSRGRLFALGIQPYLGASALLLLLSGAIDRLGRVREGTGDDRAAFDRSIVWFALIIGLMQAAGHALARRAMTDGGDPGLPWLAVASELGCAALLIAIALIVSRAGVGNGVAWVAFAALCFPGIPEGLRSEWTRLSEAGAGLEGAPIAGLLLAGLIALCHFYLTHRTELRLVPADEERSHVVRAPVTLPLRLNLAGIVPAMMAGSILRLSRALELFISPTRPWATSSPRAQWALYCALTLVLTYVVAGIGYDTRRVGPLLKRFGYVIEGAPDGPTEEYLDGIIERRMLLSVLILIAIFGAPWLIARITGIDLTAAGIPASSVLIGCAIVLDTIRHARTWRALEGPANGAGDPVEDSDPEGRPAGLEEQHAPGSEEPPDSGMEPEAAARVDVLEADTELEARLALATLEGHGIHGVMLCNRVIPLTGTLAFWEWTVPTYPFLVIHRRLGGGRVVVSVAESDADRAREVLAAVVTVVAPDEPGELAAPGDATSGGGGAVRRA